MIDERQAQGFEGHPLECDVHPGRVRFGCPDCFERDGILANLRDNEPWRLDLIAAARSAAEKETRFKHRGRSIEGLDCSGLFLFSAESVGLTYRPFNVYRRGFDGAELLAEFRSRMDEREIGDAIPSDALLVELSGSLCHAVMLTERGTLIQAHARWRKTTEHGFSFEWADRVRHVFRYRSPARGVQ